MKTYSKYFIGERLENQAKTDFDIKNRILKDTINGEMAWETITPRCYRSKIPIPDTKSQLKFEIEYITNEWCLTILMYKDRDFIGTTIKKMWGVENLAKRIVKYIEEKNQKN